MGQKKSLTLKEFIRGEVKLVGVEKFKRQFGVTESTVNHWARGVCLPRPAHMVRMVRLSGGKLSYKEMIETFVRVSGIRFK